MYKNNNKNNNKLKIIAQLSFALIAIVAIVFLSIPLSNKLKRQHSVNNEIKTLKEEIEKDKQKNGELKEFIEYLSSDQFIEEKARTNLNYKNEGETVVFIKDDSSEQQNPEDDFVYSANIKNKKQEDKFNNPRSWFNYFFN